MRVIPKGEVTGDIITLDDMAKALNLDGKPTPMRILSRYYPRYPHNNYKRYMWSVLYPGRKRFLKVKRLRNKQR